jgi:hypothetical protein
VRTIFRIFFAVLLPASTGSMAAKVEYRHPEVTIVAVDETLDSVLKTIGREMEITIKSPAGLNPVINCDIQNKPVERAFKTLLGDMSYSLIWEDNGERLAELVILSGDGEAAVVAASEESAFRAQAPQAVPMPAVSPNEPGAATVGDRYDDDPQLAEHESRMEAERLDMEVRMAEERELQEAEMELRRQEEEVAHKARVQEEQARHEAWKEEYIETYGPKMAR